MRRLAGFKSLCNTKCAWQCCTARKIITAKDFTSLAEKKISLRFNACSYSSAVSSKEQALEIHHTIHYCTTALLHKVVDYCTTVLLYYCTTVLLYYCTTVLLYYCTTVLLYHCTTVPLYYCTTVLTPSKSVKQYSNTKCSAESIKYTSSSCTHNHNHTVSDEV
jgi:hypothetical protein